STYLDTFFKKYNKIHLDTLAIEQEQKRLETENHQLRDILGQFIDGNLAEVLCTASAPAEISALCAQQCYLLAISSSCESAVNGCNSQFVERDELGSLRFSQKLLFWLGDVVISLWKLGVTLSPEILAKPNPLLIVNGRVNLNQMGVRRAAGGSNIFGAVDNAEGHNYIDSP
ncbi:hypothetical protein FOZ62_013072, partial [Perkinsus olseni]